MADAKQRLLTLFKPDTCFGIYTNSADPVQMPQSTLIAYRIFSAKYSTSEKKSPETPKTRNGLTQMIRMEKSIGQKRVNFNL